MKNTSILIGCAVVVSVGFIGCATVNQPETAKMSDSHPQFEVLCSKCHTLDRVQAAHTQFSQEQMKDIVKRMAAKEQSGIDPNSIEDIVNQIY